MVALLNILEKLPAPAKKLVDIKISYDVEAIFNSLHALFNTSPGQRLLLPEYGLDLRRLLFRPITDHTARSIGNALRDGIEKWEPRVIIEGVSIQPDPDEHTYFVSLELYIPLLKRSEQMTGRFIQGEGFIRG